MSRSGQYRWPSCGLVTWVACSIVAFRNQGKLLKGTAISSSSIRIHRQCLEMLVTSATKVVVPGIGDCCAVAVDDGLDFVETVLAKPNISGQSHFWFNPELGLSFWMADVNMRAGFFSRKEEQSVLALVKDCWRQNTSILLNEA